jgi:hypothetical protein
MARSQARPRVVSPSAPTPRRRPAGASPPPRSEASSAAAAASSTEWLSLTELGRLYGVSAVYTGRLLVQAGLRSPEGFPSCRALEQGLALCQHPGDHHQALWSRQGCAPHLERQGLEPQQQRSLVGLWADLLSALQQGSPSISVSAEEMASDMPEELVRPVNRELRERGCSFQVKPVRKAATPRPACSPAPASDAAAAHPYG